MTNETNKPSTDYSFKEGLELLMREYRNYKTPPYQNPTTLHLGAIKKAHSVFQPRHIKSVSCTAASENHICELVEALHAAGGGSLDPITVYWTGQAYRVIDGHHRLEAYLRYHRDKPLALIPVQTFEGTPEEAIQKAIELNSKNHLPITKDERFDRAWLMVVMGIGTKSSVSRACKIGTTTFSSMRQKLELLKGKYPDDWQETALDMTWKEAQRMERKETTYNEDWKEKQATALARRIGRSYGKRLAANPEITARALEIYSEQLTKELFRQWWSDYSPAVQEEEADSDF